MSVSFNQVGANSLLPFTFVEFDASRSCSRLVGVQPYKALLMGPRLESGSVPALVPLRVGTTEAVSEACGQGSILQHMAASFFKNNRETELWILALDDPPSGTEAIGSITFAGVAAATASFAVYVGGRRYELTIAAGTPAIAVAAAVKAVIEADAASYVTVTTGEDKGTLILSSRHRGVLGNSLDLRLGYFFGESLPRGLTATITPMTGGAGAPDLSRVLSAIGDEWFNVIAAPYSDEIFLNTLEAELHDRWGPSRPIDGHLFIAAKDDLIRSFGKRNSAHVTILNAAHSPSPPWDWAAAVAGINATEAQRDPARPYQTLELRGILGAKTNVSMAERELLVRNGITTTISDAAGAVRLERLVSTAKWNASGALDPSYRDITTKQTLSFLRWDFRQHFMSKFPRHKLADDGTRFAAGQAVLTPKTAKAEALAKFIEWEERGLVEGIDQFKRDLVCERSRSNPNRLDFMLPPDLINQLMTTAVQIGFGV